MNHDCCSTNRQRRYAVGLSRRYLSWVVAWCLIGSSASDRLLGQQIIPGQPPLTQSPTVQNPPSVNPSIPPGQPVPSIVRSFDPESFEGSQNLAGGTRVDLETTLTSLLENGGVPKSVEQLQRLERQAARVAQSTVACTVSVQIGPAQGCGVIITPSGYILSAAHVATKPGRKAQIKLSDGRRIRATTLGMNRNVDAGLLKIDPNQNGGASWPHATLGTSANLRAGMWCVATGHPGGYELSRGPVTRVGRILEIRPGSVVTDCALIGGDSGGPLFDISGRLIAIHSRIGNDVAENLHVPIDEYGKAWSRMQRSESWGYLEGFRPILGLKGDPALDEAVIRLVHPGSPAERAGLKRGDVIKRFGETRISTFRSLQDAVNDTMPGERLFVLIMRDGQLMRIRVEIGRADD